MIILYIVILVLCGVIVAQGFIFHRERLKLYSLFKTDNNGVSGKPRPTEKGKENQSKMHGHKRALIKWRNGGNGGDID